MIPRLLVIYCNSRRTNGMGQPAALSAQRYAMAALAVWPDDDAAERVA